MIINGYQNFQIVKKVQLYIYKHIIRLKTFYSYEIHKYYEILLIKEQFIPFLISLRSKRDFRILFLYEIYIECTTI